MRHAFHDEIHLPSPPKPTRKPETVLGCSFLVHCIQGVEWECPQLGCTILRACIILNSLRKPAWITHLEILVNPLTNIMDITVCPPYHIHLIEGLPGGVGVGVGGSRVGWWGME